MKGPIVSIDVSNGNSHFQCFTQRGTKMGKVHRISHTVEGFNFLKSKIEELEKKTNEEVVAVYEATGVYAKPLERFLEKNEIKQYSISPLQSAKQRKTEIHNKKTDKKVYIFIDYCLSISKEQTCHLFPFFFMEIDYKGK